jgi:cell division protein FtsI (penicillin-binding protein 3)
MVLKALLQRWLRRRSVPAATFKVRRDTDAAAAPIFTPKRSVVQQRRVKVNTSLGFQPASPTQHYGSLGLADTGDLRVRLMWMMVILSLMFGCVGGRLAFVALTPPIEPRPSLREMPLEALRRGNIYDRNNILLAATLQVYSLSADPARIISAEEVANKLPTVLPDLNKIQILTQLTDPRRRFVWLKRRLTPEQAQRVIALGLPGLSFRKEFVRVYPHKELAAHVLGAVDLDNNGLAGVERAYNDILNTGQDVRLGLDIRLQERLRERILDALKVSEAKAAWGVVLKAATREIVALVSLPDFDPNHLGDAKPEARFNHVTLGSYEMGSTFKLFTLAQGLVNGNITPYTPIDARTPIHIGRFTIKDYHAKKAVLSAEEVLRYSSNIGAAKIADMGGPEAQQVFMGKLGMLEPVHAGIAEVGPVRYPSNWGRIQTFTIAFGHGMMVTPLHLVTAVATLADGVYLPPSVMLGGVRAVDPSVTAQVVISNTVVLEQIHRLMRDVVLNGSGRSSQLAGYDIGGKTGTAEKIGGGVYLKDKNLVSFVGVLPMKNPEYITLVMVDEPKKGYETGGKVAAPAVGAFYRDLTQVMGIPPVMEEVIAYRGLLRKFRRSETDPYAPYLLTDMRTRMGRAAGILNERPNDEGGVRD